MAVLPRGTLVRMAKKRLRELLTQPLRRPPTSGVVPGFVMPDPITKDGLLRALTAVAFEDGWGLYAHNLMVFLNREDIACSMDGALSAAWDELLVASIMER